MKPADTLANVSTLAVDTSPFIYFLENDPAFFTITKAVFAYTTQRKIQISVSSLILTEILMKPIQAQNIQLQEAYRIMLLNTSNVSTVPITSQIAIRAAELRATYNLRTPDALHIGSAIVSDADAFLTNDMALKRVKEIPIYVLSDFEN